MKCHTYRPDLKVSKIVTYYLNGSIRFTRECVCASVCVCVTYDKYSFVKWKPVCRERKRRFYGQGEMESIRLLSKLFFTKINQSYEWRQHLIAFRSSSFFHRLNKGSLHLSFYACVDCIDVRFQSLKMQNVEFSADRKIPIENAKCWGKHWVAEFKVWKRIRLSFLKTQLHAVNTRWKWLSQHSLRVIQVMTLLVGAKISQKASHIK